MSEEIITTEEKVVASDEIFDFSGTYNPKIDEKGRFFVPAKFREILEKDGICTITHGFDGCLWLYSAPVWKDVYGNLKKLSDMRENERQLKRFFLGGAKDCELDKQGRILIPPDLREFANIGSEICIVGMGNKIEIWSVQQRENYEAKAVVSPEAIAESLDNLVL